MNSLRKKIKYLEEDIAQRKRLSVQSYAAAKKQMEEAIVSPTAFGIAFFSGMLLTLRRKKVPAKNTKTQTSATAVNFFNILSELSSLLMLVQYAQKLFNKNESTS